MPTVRHKPAIWQITRQLDRLLSQTDRDLEYMSLGFITACFEFKSVHRLTWRYLRGLLQAIEFIEYRGYISKTSLFDYLGERYDKNNDELPEVLTGFFFRDRQSKRFTLSPAGVDARAQWATLLRRVLRDEKERYRLLYDRWNKDQVQERRKRKRFFELPHMEQINLARQFFAMPRGTEEERRHVQAARRYLYLNFDVRPLDLYGLSKQNPIIRAVQDAPPTAGEDAQPQDLETIFRRPEQPPQTPDNSLLDDNTPQQHNT